MSGNVDSVMSKSDLDENVGVEVEIASLYKAYMLFKGYCRFRFHGRLWISGRRGWNH
jgi:hypothetical protein